MSAKQQIDKGKLIGLVNERARQHSPPNTNPDHCQIHDVEPTHAPAPFPNWKWNLANDPHLESSATGVDALMAAVAHFQAGYDVAWPAAPQKAAPAKKKR